METSRKADHECNEPENRDCNDHPRSRIGTQGCSHLSKGVLITVRKTTRSTDERSTILTPVPRSGMSDRAPILHLESSVSEALLVATMNSFVLDYTARNSIGGTDLSYFILKQLPVPNPSDFLKIFCFNESYKDFIIPRVLELVYTTESLENFASSLGYSGPPFAWNESRQFILRSELDAVFFRLYGLDSSEVNHVMETFPIVKRKDENQWGNYRTKITIMKMYHEMQEAAERGVHYRTWLDPEPVRLPS